jgi:[ribosomal protein S5]-alanine N-acetyltransferase
MVVKLETERLILRKPKLSDAEDWAEGMGDIDVSRRVSGAPHPYTLTDAKKQIDKKLIKMKKKDFEKFSFVIVLKNENKVIGSITLGNIDRKNGICSSGSWINKRYWKKGYMTEAKIATNNFVFNELGLRRMETGAFTDNKASNATQLAVGYKYEGCRRKRHMSKATGKIHDENMYGLLKEDWKKKLPKLKKHLKTKIKKLGKK